MSTSLVIAFAWPPIWGFFYWTLARAGLAPSWYPPVGYLAVSLVQLIAYSILWAAGAYPPSDHVTIPPALGSAVNVAAAIAWMLWRRRKDIKRKLAAMGAKGKARIAAMVRKVQERAQPRPVLRPVRIPA